MTVGYVAQCAVRGITLESLAIETDGEIDLRGFGIDPNVPQGYEKLRYTVLIRGNGTKQQFAEISRGGDGDLAQFLQFIADRGSQTDLDRRVIAGSGEACFKQAREIQRTGLLTIDRGSRLAITPLT